MSTTKKFLLLGATDELGILLGAAPSANAGTAMKKLRCTIVAATVAALAASPAVHVAAGATPPASVRRPAVSSTERALVGRTGVVDDDVDLRGPVGLALDRDGSFLVIDQFAGSCGCGELFRVDPATGTRTLVSDFGNPLQGPHGANPRAVAIAADGGILTDGCPGASGNGALCRIDSTSGTRTNFGDFGDATLGPVALGTLGTLAVYP